MKRYPIDPDRFDGAKFAARYGLSSGEDGSPTEFWAAYEGTQLYLYIGRPKVDRTGEIVRNPDKSPVMDDIHLPDDPPIFEPPDPIPVRPSSSFDAVDSGNATPDQVGKVLQYLRKTGRI